MVVAIPPDVLSGPRLDLVLVSVDQLLSREGDATPVPLGFDDPYDVLRAEHSPLRHRIPQVKADPSINPWLVRLAVVRSPGPQIVGQANFHDRPDDGGMVEIGYSILPAFRERGYAREVAMTMWDFAASHPDVRVLRATVRPDNEASLRIIRGAGLVHVGEQDDPEDGLELIFELSAVAFRLARTAGIRQFRPTDRDAVIELWRECGLLRQWNDPVRDIDRKLADSSWGLLVAEQDERLVGAMMVGYDGHRGSVNYLAVAPDMHGTGLGRRLVAYGEAQLLARGCPKVNLSVRADSASAIGFYEHLGYVVEGSDHAVALGHRLIADDGS